MLRVHLLPPVQFTGKAFGTGLESFTSRRSCCNWKQPQAPLPHCPSSMVRPLLQPCDTDLVAASIKDITSLECVHEDN